MKNKYEKSTLPAPWAAWVVISLACIFWIVIVMLVVMVRDASAAPRGEIGIPLRIIYVDSPDNIGVPETERLVDAAAALLSRLKGIHVYREKTLWYADAFPNSAVDYESRVLQLDSWTNALRDGKSTLRGGVTIVATGPLRSQDGMFLGGISNSKCQVGSDNAVVVVNLWRGRAAWWIPQTVLVMHEVAHQLGAFHTAEGKCNIMQIDVMTCASQIGKVPRFSQRSVVDMRVCVMARLK